jgi:hypothetical protein
VRRVGRTRRSVDADGRLFFSGRDRVTPDEPPRAQDLHYVTLISTGVALDGQLCSDIKTLAVVCLLLRESRSPGAHMEAQAIRTKRDDDVRQCIEAAIARRKDEFALSRLV